MSEPRRVSKYMLDKTAYDRLMGTVTLHSEPIDGWWFSDEQLLGVLLDKPTDYAWCIEALRNGEAHARQMRQRLEALRDGVDRRCALAACRKPIHGRADRKFCSSACRVKAYRGDPVTEAGDEGTPAAESTPPRAPSQRRLPLPDAARRAGWELRGDGP